MRDVNYQSREAFVSWQSGGTYSYWNRDQLSQLEAGVVIRCDGIYLGRA